MIIVNGEKLPIYILDTEESILLRIATKLKTLKKYLYNVPSPVPRQDGTRLEVVNLIAKAQEYASKSIDFGDFVNDYPQLGQPLLGDLCKIWIAYNKVLCGSGDESDAAKQIFTLSEGAKYITDVEAVCREKVDIFRRLNSEINVEKELSRKTDTGFKELEEQKALATTPFKVESVALDITLDLADVTLLEMFNYLLLDQSVPFASCKNYYKILKNFVPPDEWGVQEHDQLTLKVSRKDGEFETAKLRMEGELLDEKTILSVTISSEKGGLSREQYLQRILGRFRRKIGYQSIQETKVKGVFYFPNTTLRFDPYVFADLVMNDNLFSAFFYIDESTKATKERVFNLHFRPGDIMTSITEKRVDASTERDLDSSVFKQGDLYITVSVKRAKTRDSIEFFQTILSKILILYEKRYNQIVAFYQTYLPDFGKVETVFVEEKKDDSLPSDVFVRNYSRTCAKNRFPKIASAEEKDAIIFPRDKPESGKAYPSDGINQYRYSCPNPDYPFPGVQLNKLANSEVYPYVPCCFKTEQSDKKGGEYRQYYHGEFPERDKTGQQGLIITDKILGENKTGKLGKTLTSFFQLLDTNTDYEYIRIGVARNPSSLLGAVLFGIGSDLLTLNDKDERLAALLQERERFAEEELAVLAKQSCYDLSLEKLQTDLRNPNHYLDPRLYTQLLETVYHCKLFVFTKENGLILPRYTQGYYTPRSTRNCLLIYENLGSESDMAKYPQCELIGKWNRKGKEDDIEYLFENKNPLSIAIEKIAKAMTDAYVLTSHIDDVVFPKKRLNIVSQSIDSYGKTRRIDVDYKETLLTVLTSPLMPLPVVLTTRNEPLISSPQTALAFLNDLNAKNIQQQSDAVSGVIGNVSVSIPTKAYPPVSNLSQFLMNKKMARYLTDYTLWRFSDYLYRQNIQEITDEVFNRFAETNFHVDNSHSYSEVKKAYTGNNSILRDGKITLTSEEMRKRLMYVLRLQTTRDERGIRKYYLRKGITDYYLDISDFDLYSTEIILQGESAFQKWIGESERVSQLYSGVVPKLQVPYFIKNNRLSNTVVLAQNASTLSQAKAIAEEWNKEHRNPVATTSTTVNNTAFTLYLYSDENTIEKKVVKGQGLADHVKIVVYKLDNKLYYTTLMEIN